MVRDGKFRGYRDELRPGFYVPASQQYRGAMTLEARTVGNAAAFGGTLRREIANVDSSMPLTSVLTMEARLDDVLSQERLIASFSSGLGVVALTLAAIGIYRVRSFAVARGTRGHRIPKALA